MVALLAALQLGDFFGAGDELVLVMLGVAAYTILSLLAFALVYAVAWRAGAFTVAALLLGVVALAPAMLPGLVRKIADHSTNPYALGVEHAHIVLELVIPALLAVLVQWGLVQRRWLRAAGDEALTRWPWITTAVAALVILNPFGLAFLDGTLNHSASDLMWEFTATVTGAVIGTLLVMAWVECYIRERMLNRRMPSSPPPQAPDRGEAEAPG
jgi:hypothetical protein